ncbi:MAG: hypothetical protein ACWIPH_02285 [Ostreibacterium sp.]
MDRQTSANAELFFNKIFFLSPFAIKQVMAVNFKGTFKECLKEAAIEQYHTYPLPTPKMKAICERFNRT